MRCIPKYTVIYHGTLCPPGIPFKIDPKDADEMRTHGNVLDEAGTGPPAVLEDHTQESLPRRAGRPRKIRE